MACFSAAWATFMAWSSSCKAAISSHPQVADVEVINGAVLSAPTLFVVTQEATRHLRTRVTFNLGCATFLWSKCLG